MYEKLKKRMKNREDELMRVDKLTLDRVTMNKPHQVRVSMYQGWGTSTTLTSYVNFKNENNSASERNTAKLFTSFHSESTVYSIEINISSC